jgi:hypothetical protein
MESCLQAQVPCDRRRILWQVGARADKQWRPVTRVKVPDALLYSRAKDTAMTQMGWLPVDSFVLLDGLKSLILLLSLNIIRTLVEWHGAACGRESLCRRRPHSNRRPSRGGFRPRSVYHQVAGNWPGQFVPICWKPLFAGATHYHPASRTRQSTVRPALSRARSWPLACGASHRPAVSRRGHQELVVCIDRSARTSTGPSLTRRRKDT